MILKILILVKILQNLAFFLEITENIGYKNEGSKIHCKEVLYCLLALIAVYR